MCPAVPLDGHLGASLSRLTSCGAVTVGWSRLLVIAVTDVGGLGEGRQRVIVGRRGILVVDKVQVLPHIRRPTESVRTRAGRAGHGEALRS